MSEENEKRKSQYPVRRESDDSLQAAKHQSRLPAQIGSNLFLAAPIAWQFAKFGATHSARITWNLAKLIRDILNSDFVYEHQRQLLAATAILVVYVTLIAILAASGLSFVQIALFLLVLTFLCGCAVAPKRQKAKEFMKRRNRRRGSSGRSEHQRTNYNLHRGAEAPQQPRGKEWFTRMDSSNQSRRNSKGGDAAKQNKQEETNMWYRRRITDEEWRHLYDKQDGKCVFCKRRLYQTGSNSNTDHKIPLSRGGADSIRNLQLLCKWCNRSKGALTNAEFKRKLEGRH